MTAPTAPPTAPNRADGAEPSDYATTPPTAPSPLGRGGVVGAVAVTSAGTARQRRTRRGRALALPTESGCVWTVDFGAITRAIEDGDPSKTRKPGFSSISHPEPSRKPSKMARTGADSGQQRCV